jgi:hypothetical protein
LVVVRGGREDGFCDFIPAKRVGRSLRSTLRDEEDRTAFDP